MPVLDTASAKPLTGPADAVADANPIQINTDLTDTENPIESGLSGIDAPSWGVPTVGQDDFQAAMSNSNMHPNGFSNTFDGDFGGGTATGTREQVVQYAKKFLGVNYVWGGTSPSGFDCSGLVQYVTKHFGLNLPRISAAQANYGKRTSLGALQAGDLVAWDENGRNNGADHIAFYIGNGYILEAPHTGAQVRIRKLGKSEGAFGVALNYPK